jgi:hypothetical protein
MRGGILAMAILRMTTAQGAKNTSLGWEKANKHVRVGIEARSGSKKLMTMIDKRNREDLPNVRRLIAQTRRRHTARVSN